MEGTDRRLTRGLEVEGFRTRTNIHNEFWVNLDHCHWPRMRVSHSYRIAQIPKENRARRTTQRIRVLSKDGARITARVLLGSGERAKEGRMALWQCRMNVYPELSLNSFRSWLSRRFAQEPFAVTGRRGARQLDRCGGGFRSRLLNVKIRPANVKDAKDVSASECCHTNRHSRQWVNILSCVVQATAARGVAVAGRGGDLAGNLNLVELSGYCVLYFRVNHILDLYCFIVVVVVVCVCVFRKFYVI